MLEPDTTPSRNADNNGDRSAATVAPSDASSPGSQHAEQQQRQRVDRQPAAAIEKHRRDRDQRAERADDQSADQQQHVLGHDHRQEVRLRVAERAKQRQLSPPFEHVPKQDRAEPERSQHQSQPAKHLKG